MKLIRKISLPILLAWCCWLPVFGHAADATPVPSVTVYMMGDSTMADYPLKPASPIRGWGQILPMYFKPNVRIENRAVCGYTTAASLKNRWPDVLRTLQAGDFVIIQFGHNDSKPKNPDYCPAFGNFQENLIRFVRETREQGAIPILVTPVARRIFAEDGVLNQTHGDYPEATRKVGADLNVPVLEMTLRTMDLLQSLGPERSAKLFSNPEPGEYPEYTPPKTSSPGSPNPAVDNTHFNALGASRIADLAAEELRRVVPELAQWLRK